MGADKRFDVLIPVAPERVCELELDDERVPVAARRLAKLSDPSAQITYALARDNKLDRMVASVAVRWAPGRWAMFVDGHFTSACWLPHYGCGAAEIAAFASGALWTPPVVVREPCGACGKTVRVKKDGLLWAHRCAP